MMLHGLAGYFLAVPDTSGKTKLYKFLAPRKGEKVSFMAACLWDIAWIRVHPPKKNCGGRPANCLLWRWFSIFWGGSFQVPGSKRFRWLFKLPLLEWNVCFFLNIFPLKIIREWMMHMQLMQWISDFLESFCCGGGLQTCWQTSFKIHECQVFVDQGVLVLFLPVFLVPARELTYPTWRIGKLSSSSSFQVTFW